MLPLAEAVELLDTIPGVAPASAQVNVSEIGTDMSRFPNARHLAAWAGVAPGNHESGGKRLSGRARQGNHSLCQILVQAAHAASRTRGTYLSSLFHRLAARRGKKRAVLAVAHSMVVSIYHMLVRKQVYTDLGHDYLDQLRPEATTKRLIGRLETLGFTVTLQPKADLAA